MIPFPIHGPTYAPRTATRRYGDTRSISRHKSWVGKTHALIYVLATFPFVCTRYDRALIVNHRAGYRIRVGFATLPCLIFPKSGDMLRGQSAGGVCIAMEWS